MPGSIRDWGATTHRPGVLPESGREGKAPAVPRRGVHLRRNYGYRRLWRGSDRRQYGQTHGDGRGNQTLRIFHGGGPRQVPARPGIPPTLGGGQLSPDDGGRRSIAGIFARDASLTPAAASASTPARG